MSTDLGIDLIVYRGDGFVTTALGGRGLVYRYNTDIHAVHLDDVNDVDHTIHMDQLLLQAHTTTLSVFRTVDNLTRNPIVIRMDLTDKEETSTVTFHHILGTTREGFVVDHATVVTIPLIRYRKLKIYEKLDEYLKSIFVRTGGL